MKNFDEELSMIRNWHEGCHCTNCSEALIKRLESRLKKNNQPASVTYKRKTKTLREWSKITGIPFSVLSTRKSKEWSDKKIIETPYKPTPPAKTIRYKNQTKTCNEWAAITGISSAVIRARYFYYDKSAHQTLTEPVRN